MILFEQTKEQRLALERKAFLDKKYLQFPKQKQSIDYLADKFGKRDIYKNNNKGK